MHFCRIVIVLALITGLVGTASANRVEFNVKAKMMIRYLEDEERSGGTTFTKQPGRTHKSAARAMLLSAILPGLGQIYAGGTRGLVSGGLMATADVLSIWRYLVNDGKGDDFKSDYELWARSHYDIDRFLHYVRDTVVVESGYEGFGQCTNDAIYDSAACWDAIDLVFPLADEGSPAYYDQIGMDEMFVFGWDDWDPYDVSNLEDVWLDWAPYKGLPDSLPSSSPNKDHYNYLRKQADDFYSRADRYAWIMVIGRVVSMIDAAILVKLQNRELAALPGSPRLTFVPKFGRNPGFKLGLKVRF